MNDSGTDGRAVPPIAIIDVLDHLLAPLVLEINIDIGRLVALLGDESRKEKFALLWIDLRDTDTEAHGTVGCRAASLAEDRLLQVPRIMDNIVYRQEIARILKSG